jgi:phytoene synthase
MGRLYLPYDALQSAAITSTEPATVVAHPAVAQACAPIVAMAVLLRRHYAAVPGAGFPAR